MPRTTRQATTRPATPAATTGRQKAARRPRTRPSAAAIIGDASPHPGPLALSPTAAALVDRIEHDYQLTDAVRALLRLVGEHLTRAEQFDAILARDGLVVGDQKGSVKPHPAALLARDHRNAASTGLQRLLANLEGS